MTEGESVLIAKIDDYSTSGEIGVKMASVRGLLASHLLAHKAVQINELCVSLVRKGGLRESCKSPTIFKRDFCTSEVALSMFSCESENMKINDIKVTPYDRQTSHQH